MALSVIKRDGRTVSFQKYKIKDAIESAFMEVDGEITKSTRNKANQIAKDIEKMCSEKDMTVEEIQNIVENKLMASNRKDVAKAYIIYRNERTKIRENNSQLKQMIEEKIKASNVQNQNANVDEKSFGGRIGEASDIVQKWYALNNCMSEKAVYNHIHNLIYTHDLASYASGMHNCLSIPFDKLLADGFSTRQVDIRPAKSISTALQLVAVINQLQSLQEFGGTSATHIDWTLVPYVRLSLFKHYLIEYLKSTEEFYKLDLENMDDDELDDWVSENKNFYLTKFNLSTEDFYVGNDKLDKKLYQSALFETRKELTQSVEALYHNLNSLQSRSGNQLPFTSINYGTCTLPEGRMVIKALLNGCIKGVGKFRKTSIFPCGIFQIMSGVNKEKGTPNYDLKLLALKSTAQRLYPNYANCDWSVNAGYDKNDPKTYVSTMGCRTYNAYDINGLGFQKDGRGNICPVTIILPTIAMHTKQSLKENEDIEEKFLSDLDRYIHEAKDQLIERFEYICSQSPSSSTFMYENGLMEGYIKEEGIRSALKHGTLAVGC